MTHKPPKRMYFVKPIEKPADYQKPDCFGEKAQWHRHSSICNGCLLYRKCKEKVKNDKLHKRTKREARSPEKPKIEHFKRF